MNKNYIIPITRNIIQIAGKLAIRHLEKELSPYIVKGVIYGSWLGIFPSYKITVKEKIRCSSCGRYKKGKFLIINIPATGGQINICSTCEQREHRKVQKWLSGIRKKKTKV